MTLQVVTSVIEPNQVGIRLWVPSTHGPAFVCESNVGFTTRQLTNTQRCEPQTVPEFGWCWHTLTAVNVCDGPGRCSFQWTICWFQFQVENPGQLWGPQNLVFCTKFHIVPLIFQVPGGHEQALLPEFPHTKLCKAAMNGPLPLSLLVSLDDINPTVSPLLALVFYCRVFIWRYWDKGWWNPQNQPKAKVKLPFHLCSSCWLSP